MQVNSVSLNGRVSATPFGNSTLRERFAALDEQELKQLAYAKSSQDVNDKKHKRLDRAILVSVPLSAGVAAAVAAKSMSRIGRLAAFGIGAASWLLPFAVVDTVFGAEKIAKKNKSFKDFANEHPMAVALGTFAASTGVYLGLRHGAMKGLDKYGDKLLEKASPYLNKLAKSLNSSKLLDKTSSELKKVPSSIKEFTKTALNWSPWLLLMTSIAHTFSHDEVKAKTFAKNFEELKIAQNLIRQDLTAQKTAELVEETDELAKNA